MPDLQQHFDRLTEDVDSGRFVDPASIRRRGDTRTRRQLAGGAAALAAVVAAGAIVAVNLTDGDASAPPLDPSPTPSVSESPTPAPTATAEAYTPSKEGARVPTTVDGPTTLAMGPALIPVPDGWHAYTVTFDSACVEPKDPRPSGIGCGGFNVFYGWDGEVPGNEWGTFTREHPGWSQATGLNYCPDGAESSGENWEEVPGDLTANGTLSPVGDRQAYYYEWLTGCSQGDFTFTPRAWYLPTSQVLFVDGFGYDDVEGILSGVTYDTGHWTTAFLVGGERNADGVVLAVDEVTWTSANPDLADRESDQQLIDDPDPTAANTPVAADVQIIGLDMLTGGFRERYVTVDDLLEFVGIEADHETPFHVHVTAGGVIDKVVEEGTFHLKIRR